VKLDNVFVNNKYEILTNIILAVAMFVRIFHWFFTFRTRK